MVSRLSAQLLLRRGYPKMTNATKIITVIEGHYRLLRPPIVSQDGLRAIIKHILEIYTEWHWS